MRATLLSALRLKRLRESIDWLVKRRAMRNALRLDARVRPTNN
jgi:hypothetical protein